MTTECPAQSHGSHGGHAAAVTADMSQLRCATAVTAVTAWPPVMVVTADSDESRREHAGSRYPGQCLGCKQTFFTIVAMGQHTGSPYLRGTRYAVQNSATELRNAPRAHLATGQAQSVPIFHAGTLARCI